MMILKATTLKEETVYYLLQESSMNLLPTQNAFPDLVRFSSFALLWTHTHSRLDTKALIKSINVN